MFSIFEYLGNEEIRKFFKYKYDYFSEKVSFQSVNINCDEDVLDYLKEFEYYFYIKSRGLKDYLNPKLMLGGWIHEEIMAPNSMKAGDIFKFNFDYKPKENLNICPSGFYINKWVGYCINYYENYYHEDTFSAPKFFDEFFHFNPSKNEFIIDDCEAEMSSGGLFSVFHKGRLIITNKRILFNDTSDYDKDYSFQFKFDKNLEVIEKKKLLLEYLIFLADGKEYEVMTTLSASTIKEYKNTLFKDNK